MAMWKLLLCKEELPKSPYAFSKDWSYRLKGVLAIIIIIHHVSTRYSSWWGIEEYPLSYSIISKFIPWGEIVVGLFFFISGYGLIKSYQRYGDDYISSFMSKRFFKIFIPFVIIEFITQILLVTFKDGYSPWQILIDAYPQRGFGFILWFPIALSLFYLAFYFCFKYIRITHIAIAAVTLIVVVLSLYYYFIGRGDWWWKSNLCFPIGLWYAYYEHKFTKWIALRPKLWITLLALIVIGLAQLTRKTSYAFITLRTIILLFPFFVVMVSYYVKSGRNKVSNFLGNISWEMFLTQFVFLELLSHIPPMLYCIMLIMCVLCASVIMNIIDNKILKILQR